MKKITISFFILIVICWSFDVASITPPTKEEVKKFKSEGTWGKKVEFLEALGNHKTHPSLVQRAHRYLNRNHSHRHAAIESLEATNKSTPVPSSMPSMGDVNILVLLVEFENYLHAPENTRESIDEKIFGRSNSDNPFDSVAKFYSHSSYDQLRLSGNVLDWYKTPYPRTDDIQPDELIKEVINYHDEKGHDFSQYDSNDDGVIDYLVVIWSGPSGDWATLWWGWFSNFWGEDFIVDGVQLGGFSWQWDSRSYPSGSFNNSVLIHETGHALGLPDFYDYDTEIGPKGGVGGADIMGTGSGGHSAFNKFMLGWIEPRVINSGEQQLTFKPATDYKDALLITPEVSDDRRYGEYYMAEYRRRAGADVTLPNDGLFIWHIDATPLEGTPYFKNDNSFSDNKLIRLVQADGLGQIEDGFSVDAQDVFKAGDRFSPNSLPASVNNSGDPTGVDIEIESESELTVNFSAGIRELPEFIVSSQINERLVSGNYRLSAEAAHSNGIEKIELRIDDVLLFSATSNTLEYEWDTTKSSDGTYRVLLTAYTPDGLYKNHRARVHIINDSVAAVADLSTSDPSKLANETITDSLLDLNMNAITTHSILDFTPEKVPVLFLKLGAMSLAHALTDSESETLVQYVNEGGKFYLEGANTWFATEQKGIHQLFGINSTSDGNSFSPTRILGQAGTVTESLNYYNIDSSVSVDHLVVDSATGQSRSLWRHENPDYDCTVSTITDDYRVIGSSCLFDGIPQEYRSTVINAYLQELGHESSDVSKIQFLGEQSYVDESSEYLDATVIRSGNRDLAASINFETKNGTAVAGIDFEAAAGVVDFAEGEVKKVIYIPLIDNDIYAQEKNFFIELSGDGLGERYQHSVKIIDNDNPPTGQVAFSRSTFVATVSADSVTLPLSRVNGGDGAIEVGFTTKDGSAAAGVEYISSSGTVIFTSGETEKSIVIELLHNSSAQNKTFSVELTGSSLGSPSSISVTIPRGQVNSSSPGSGGLLEWWFLILVSSIYAFRTKG